LRFTIELATLTLGVSSPEVLPVLERSRRAALRSFRVAEAVEAVPDTMFGGRPRTLDFGLLQYGLRATSTRARSDFAWDLGLGMQALGGDLQVTAVGGVMDRRLTSLGDEIRWRRVFGGGGRLATQLEVGDLYHPGSAP